MRRPFFSQIDASSCRGSKCVLWHEQVQKLLFETATHLLERITTRAIRCVSETCWIRGLVSRVWCRGSGVEVISEYLRREPVVSFHKKATTSEHHATSARPAEALPPCVQFCVLHAATEGSRSPKTRGASKAEPAPVMTSGRWDWSVPGRDDATSCEQASLIPVAGVGLPVAFF